MVSAEVEGHTGELAFPAVVLLLQEHAPTPVPDERMVRVMIS
jgi:hypothetical protein